MFNLSSLDLICETILSIFIIIIVIVITGRFIFLTIEEIKTAKKSREIL